MKRNNKSIPFFICNWLVLAVLCMQFVVSFCMKKYLGIVGSGFGVQCFYILMTQAFAILVPCLLAWLLTGGKFRTIFGAHKIKPLKGIGCVLLGLCLQPVAILANMPLQRLVPASGGVINPPENIGQVIAMVFVVCIVPAVCEELLMRGMVLTSLKNRGYVFSIIVSSAMFALLHCDAGTVVGHIVLGVVTAFAVLNTRSVYAGVLVHSSFNFCGVIIDYILTRFYIPDGYVGSFDFFLHLGIGGFVLSGIFLGCVHSKKVKKIKSEDLGYSLLDAFLNIPFAAMIIIYILYAVM